MSPYEELGTLLVVLVLLLLLVVVVVIVLLLLLLVVVILLLLVVVVVVVILVIVLVLGVGGCSVAAEIVIIIIPSKANQSNFRKNTLCKNASKTPDTSSSLINWEILTLLTACHAPPDDTILRIPFSSESLFSPSSRDSPSE